MILRCIAALAIASFSLAASALSPQTEELMALDRKLQRYECIGHGMAIEQIVVSTAGDAARLRALEAEGKTMHQEAKPLLTRRDALREIPEADRAAYDEFRARMREVCPFAKFKGGGVPRDLPPAKSPEEARFYVNALVPLTLAKLRMCEVLDPKRKGELERTWAASRFSKLDVPELHATVADVRAWMKDGITIHPTSPLAKGSSQEAALYCGGAAADLKRVEAAMPPGYLK